MVCLHERRRDTFSCSVDEEMEKTNPDEFDPGKDIRGEAASIYLRTLEFTPL